MKHMFLLALFAGAATINGCGAVIHPPQDSIPQDVAMPGTPGGKNKLVWHEDGKIVLGLCPEGVIPVRQYCTKSIVMPFDPFTTNLEGILKTDLADREGKYTTERNKLRDVVPEVVAKKKEISGLKVDIENLEGKVPQYEKAIANKLTQIDTQDLLLKRYGEQIESAKAHLRADPNNEDLKRLIVKLEEDRVTAVAKRSQMDAQLLRIRTGLAEVKRLGEEKAAIKVSKEQEFKEFYDGLEVTSPDVEKLKQEFDDARSMVSRYPKALGMIRDASLSYRYDLLEKADQLVVDRIATGLANREATVKLQGIDKPFLVFHNKEWRPTCDDGFDRREADVICRSLGLKTKEYRTEIVTEGNYWLSDLKCAGTEDVLERCAAAPWGEHHCYKEEGVALVCE